MTRSSPDSAHDDSDEDALDASALQELLLANDTLESFLHDLVVLAARDTHHHCGVTVRDGDGALTVASSDEFTSRLDELQYAEGQGPCLESLQTRVPVFVTDMATEARWAPYPQRAFAIGAHSSLAYPLLAGDTCVGALNFYASTAVAPSVELQARVSAIAANAAGALALALRVADRESRIARLRQALRSRSTIDQAVGVLMAEQRSSAREAFELLRSTSQCRNLKLRDLAAQIVAGVERGRPDSAPAHS